MPPVISETVVTSRHALLSAVLGICALALAGLGLASTHWHLAMPDSNSMAPMTEIGVLVFREGLECVLVLAAISAGAAQTGHSYGRAIAVGAGISFVAVLVTWDIVVHILSNLSESISALALQAATGLLAVIVLLIVMNWFFHKLYWTGWISAHSAQKRKLLDQAKTEQKSVWGVLWGMGLLGFTSVYREGFEVVLFLQSYRLKFGGRALLGGVCIGLFLSATVAVLTFFAHRKLPYRKMLVGTGVLLGIVLIVMVGEQAQEMQLAHWITTTTIPWLVPVTPAWMGLWFSVFPTVETLLAQAMSVLLVLGSYVAVNRITARNNQLGETRNN